MAHGAPDYWQVTVPGLPIVGGGQVVWFESDSDSVPATSHKDLINYVVPDEKELHVCSGIVSCNYPVHQRYDLRITPAATWILPTSYADPDGVWSYPEEAYDEDFSTYALTNIIPDTWSKYLILLVNEQNIDKIKFYARYGALEINQIDVDVYYEDDWHDVYEGVFAHREWVEKDIPAGVKLVSKARVRFYYTGEWLGLAELYEFRFNTSGVTPQVGIWFDTHAVIPFTSQAPYIVQSKATFAVRAYNDDDAAHDMAVTLGGFLQSIV